MLNECFECKRRDKSIILFLNLKVEIEVTRCTVNILEVKIWIEVLLLDILESKDTNFYFKEFG